MKSKISNGLNDRPIDETISSTAPGLPDDSSHPVEISDDEIRRMEEKLKGPSTSVDEEPEDHPT